MADMDEQIFALLQQDGRISYLSLAEQIGVSRAAVTQRLDALIADGVLRVVAAVHPEFLGLKALAHVSIQTAGPAEPAMEALAGWPSVVLVSATSGSHDVVIEVRVPDHRELYATIAKIRSLPNILTVNTLLYVDVVRGIFMPRAPLSPGIKVDRHDLALIRLLQADGRASFRELADTVGLSSSSVRNRVNYLLENNVMRIGAALDRRSDTRNVAAGIGINVTGDGDAVIAELAGLDGVEFLARTIGRFDVVATLAAESTARLRAATERLKSVQDVVRVESWMHLQTFKERYEWPLPAPGGAGARS